MITLKIYAKNQNCALIKYGIAKLLTERVQSVYPKVKENDIDIFFFEPTVLTNSVIEITLDESMMFNKMLVKKITTIIRDPEFQFQETKNIKFSIFYAQDTINDTV